RHTRFSRDWSSDVCSSDLDVRGDAVDGLQIQADVDIADKAFDAVQVDIDLRQAEVVVDEEVRIRAARGGRKYRRVHQRYVRHHRSEERRVGKGGGARGARD